VCEKESERVREREKENKRERERERESLHPEGRVQILLGAIIQNWRRRKAERGQIERDRERN